MEFWRWGNHVPQKHNIGDFVTFHTPPVEYGIYAFPKGFVERYLIEGSYGNICNGRYCYVRDEKKRKIMMTIGDYQSIDYDYQGFVTSVPSGLEMIIGWKKQELRLSTKDGRYTFREIDKEEVKRYGLDVNESYPLVKENSKPKKFEYNGNIWHHFEFTYPSAIEAKCITYPSEIEVKCKRLVRPEEIIHKSYDWILTDMKTYEKAYTKALNIYKYNYFIEQKKNNNWGNPLIEGRPGGMPKSLLYLSDFEVFIEKVK